MALPHPGPQKRAFRLLAGLVLAGSFLAAQRPVGSSPAGDPTDSAVRDPAPWFIQGMAEFRTIYMDNLRLPEAEAAGRRLLALVEERIGPDSPETIELRGMLAQVVMSISKKRLPEAIRLAEEALAAAERLYPPRDPRLRLPLQHLAGVLDNLGSFAEGRVVLTRILELCEADAGEDDECTAKALTALGNNSRQLGDYREARLFYERALAVQEALPDPDAQPITAHVLYALSTVCSGEEDYDQAIAFAERGVRILEKVFTTERWYLYQMYNQLGGLYGEVGRYEEARDMAGRSIEHWRKTLGEDSGDYAMGLSNQARSISRLGDHQAALEQSKRALEINARRVPPGDRTLAFFWRNLAFVHIDAGQDAEAEGLLENALRVREAAYGPNHISVAETLDLLAGVEYRLGRHTEAFEHALRAESIARANFQDRAAILSESKAYRFEFSRASSLRYVLSALNRPEFVRSARMIERAWDDVVRSRALVLDEIASRARAAAEMDDPAIAALAQELRQAKSRLASLVLLGDDTRPDPASGPLAEAQARKESLERELASRSAEFRRGLAHRETGFTAVRSALPPDSALLAYVQFEGLLDTGSPPASAPSYAAFLVTSSSSEPLFVPLGAAREIENLVHDWKVAAAAPLNGQESAMGASEQAYRKAGRLLSERIWDPLSHRLRGVKTVFVVPDGALHLVNLATLPTGGDRYLIETGPLIHHLSTERDLARRGTGQYARDGVLIVGAPDLDAHPAPVAAAAPASGPSPGPSRPSGSAARRSADRAEPACEDFRATRFQPLQATRTEIMDVRSLVNGKYQAVELTGAAATEAAFKAMAPGRRILHIATHGFFLQDRCVSALENAASRGTAPASPVLRAAGDNPLLLSGLTLAGANRRGRLRPGDLDAEDGMLTAEEVSALDLSGTEWAVLSACETGVGKVLPGEGVLGLRRAFAVAGAGTLIMSLWRVDDAATRHWMKALYERRLAGRSTADAVREASLSMISGQRARGRTTHPFFWGGFVAEGDWR